MTDPPLHYYFWISGSSSISWSRSINRLNKRVSKVLRVLEGSSNMVTSRPDYSPDLYKHTFTIYCDRQVQLNLLAYSNDAYNMWIDVLTTLTQNESSSCNTDTGHTQNSSDTGRTHSDTGHTHIDTGHTHSDTGHTHSDTGHTHSDTGHTHIDTGHSTALQVI